MANIYIKIIEILNEYENLLNIYNSNSKPNATEKKDDFLNDDFLNFIFKNIHIHESNKNKSGGNESGDNPIRDESNDNPLRDESNDNPLRDESSDNPIRDESSDNPIRDESSDNPIRDESGDRDESSDNPIRDESGDNLLKNKSSEKKNSVKKFIKKYYKKICLLTHPDKTNNFDKNELFKRAKDNMENNFLIGIIKNAYDLKIKIDDLNEIIIEQILIDIRIIQEKIIELKRYIS
jgi:hypothetical protein